MEVVSTILKVAQQIVQAAETASRNRTRCRDLADRARNIGDILRDSSSSSTPKAAAVAGGGDTASRRRALGRLRDALAEALRLVDSCHRQSGCFSWVTSGRTAARFQEVEGRISNCVGDLGIANDARIEQLLLAGANTRAGSWKKETNRSNAKKKDGAKNGGSKSDDMNGNKARKKDVAKNGNNGGTSSGAAAAPGNAGKKKGGGQQGGKGGCRQTRGKAAAAATPRPPPPLPPRPRLTPPRLPPDNPDACSITPPRLPPDNPDACSVM